MRLQSMERRERAGMTNFLAIEEVPFHPQTSPDRSSQNSTGSDNGHYVTHGRRWREEGGIDRWGEAGTVVLSHLLTE